MSLLLSEADSFIGPQNLRVWKLLSLGGRAIWGGGTGTQKDKKEQQVGEKGDRGLPRSLTLFSCQGTYSGFLVVNKGVT